MGQRTAWGVGCGEMGGAGEMLCGEGGALCVCVWGWGVKGDSDGVRGEWEKAWVSGGYEEESPPPQPQ